jgi:hypothetical protein
MGVFVGNAVEALGSRSAAHRSMNQSMKALPWRVLFSRCLKRRECRGSPVPLVDLELVKFSHDTRSAHHVSDATRTPHPLHLACTVAEVL